ncbi:MAG: glutamine synthetase [Actinomycetota bacterium]|nr:glutamine synthetase [Actinomycetota bacterium]
MLTIDELQLLTTAGDIETVVVGFTDSYGRLCGKRFDASFFLESVATEGTHACDYLLTVDMEMEPVAGYEFASWDQGYGDVHLVPDLATLRRADWLDKSAIVLCDVHDERSGTRAEVAPRSVLRRQVANLSTHGFTAMAATELEHYLFASTYRDSAKSSFGGAEPAGWYLEDYQLLQGTRTEPFHAAVRRHLSRSGVPVESSKGEWGLGQHELNVRYADIVGMADRHVLFKQCLKETADRQGLSVTFMAKYAADRAGSSCHIHISLWRDGTNAFAGDRDLGVGGISGSDELRWFLAGCLDHARDVMVLLAPTVNSYKRFVDGSWAPTRLAWSYDNRTAGFRLVGHDQSLRIECRIPGADCNPYLALAALVAAGIDGIAHRTELAPPFDGDVYGAADLERLPTTLREATEVFASSPFAKDAFGPEVVEHYAHFFRTEQAAFDSTVTDWERRRYFERI